MTTIAAIVVVMIIEDAMITMIEDAMITVIEDAMTIVETVDECFPGLCFLRLFIHSSRKPQNPLKGAALR